MIRQSVALILFLFSTQKSFSQNENNVWYFGSTGAGLDFNNCDPIVLTNGFNAAHMWEGAASITDQITGQLLFYSDGISIYNANHVVMNNGFAQALWNGVAQNIILRKPGAGEIYYLITPEVQAASGWINLIHPNGINFATIDMSLNGGLGSVTTAFNALIDSPNCEMLAATKASNGEDIWVVSHRYGSNRFCEFQITSAGLNTTPVYQDIGPVIFTYQSGTPGISSFDAIGGLRFSPDGSKLAMTTFYNGITCLFDFDKSTGNISNPIQLQINSGGYGISFSPNNTKLFIAGEDTSTIIGPHPANGKVFQFDISSGIQSTIQSSITQIYNCSDCSFATMKLAPDGRIYLAHYTEAHPAGDGYIDVINDPDSSGLLCNFSHNEIYLNGLLGSWGLNNSIEQTDFCRETGVHVLCRDNSFSLIPNPASSTVLVHIPGKNGTLSVKDCSGKVMKQLYLQDTQEVDISDLPPGIFLMELDTDNGVLTEKLVKE